MPRVVHVLRKFEPEQWGGIETHLMGLLPELARLGWESEVHAPQERGTDGGALTAIGAAFRTFRARYPYLPMRERDRAAMVASGGNLVSPGELARLLSNRRASIFHVHTQGRLGGTVRTAARLTARPYATTLHGPVLSHAHLVEKEALRRTRGLVDLGKPYGWAVGARRVVDDADLVFVLNRSERDGWKARRDGRHLELVCHGVSSERASTQARQDARAGIPGLGHAPFVVMVGRLDRGKGQDIAVEAFLRAAPQPMHLVLAGAATDEVFARQIGAMAAAASGRVHAVGGVTPATARALLAESVLALIPSRAEPFGIVLLEAWAEGTAALFSNVDGLADIARDSNAPFGIVRANDEACWARRLDQVLGDPVELDRERRAGPARVARDYCWSALATRTAAAYRTAVLARVAA